MKYKIVRYYSDGRIKTIKGRLTMDQATAWINTPFSEGVFKTKKHQFSWWDGISRMTRIINKRRITDERKTKHGQRLSV